MSLEGINIEFVQPQDRLLMSIRVGGDTEYLVWLTRRLVKRFWPVLLALIQGRPEIQAQASAEARKALVGMQHDQALKNVLFAPPPASPVRHRPLGNEPILTSQIKAGRNKDGNAFFSILPEHGNGVDLVLADPLLHGFIKLLRDATIFAEWDLVIEIPRLTSSDPAIRGDVDVH